MPSWHATPVTAPKHSPVSWIVSSTFPAAELPGT
jgi:hypothetical protein